MEHFGNYWLIRRLILESLKKFKKYFRSIIIWMKFKWRLNVGFRKSRTKSLKPTSVLLLWIRLRHRIMISSHPKGRVLLVGISLRCLIWYYFQLPRHKETMYVARTLTVAKSRAVYHFIQKLIEVLFSSSKYLNNILARKVLWFWNIIERNDFCHFNI